MLNPMVQSDLVTYMGVTIVILFLQATIVKQKLSEPALEPIEWLKRPLLNLS